MSLELPKRVRRGAIGATAVTALLFLSGCSSADKAQIKRLAMPIPASEEGHYVHDLWMWTWLVAMIVGVLVWGLMFYVAARYRRRSAADVPVQTRYNLPIEIFYTVAPIMMVIVFFFFTLTTQDKMLKTDQRGEYDVTVVGQQWSWTFNYNVGYDLKSKRLEEKDTGKVVYEGGTTALRPTLYLVKDKPVNINLYSPDVIHSFWVPAFLFKMDIVPGRANHFTVTPDRSGTYIGRCAELCGVYHSRMLFDVKIVSQSEYDAHLEKLAEAGNTGQALGGAHVNVPSRQVTPDHNGGEK